MFTTHHTPVKQSRHNSNETTAAKRKSPPSSSATSSSAASNKRQKQQHTRLSSSFDPSSADKPQSAFIIDCEKKLQQWKRFVESSKSVDTLDFNDKTFIAIDEALIKLNLQNPVLFSKVVRNTFEGTINKDRNKIKQDTGQLLILSAEQNRIGTTLLLLALKNTNVNAKSVYRSKRGYVGWTALHSACQQGHEKIVALLLSAPGISINARMYKDGMPLGKTAYRIAYEKGYTKIKNTFLRCKDFDLNEHYTRLEREEAWDNQLYSHPFLEACRLNKSTEVARWLNSGKSIVNLEDEHFGHSAIHIAAIYGHVELLKILLECGQGIDVNKPISMKYMKDNKLNADCCMTVFDIIFDYVYEKEYEKLGEEQVAAINRDMCTLLHNHPKTDINVASKHCIAQGHDTVLSSIIWFLADKSIKDFESLLGFKYIELNQLRYHFSDDGYRKDNFISAPRFLLESYYKERKKTPDSKQKFIAAFRMLISHGNYMARNDIDIQGNTLLHYACEIGAVEMAEVLFEVDKEIEIDAKNKDGETALQVACQAVPSSPDLVALLLSKGALAEPANASSTHSSSSSATRSNSASSSSSAMSDDNAHKNNVTLLSPLQSIAYKLTSVGNAKQLGKTEEAVELQKTLNDLQEIAVLLLTHGTNLSNAKFPDWFVTKFQKFQAFHKAQQLQQQLRYMLVKDAREQYTWQDVTFREPIRKQPVPLSVVRKQFKEWWLAQSVAAGQTASTSTNTEPTATTSASVEQTTTTSLSR